MRKAFLIAALIVTGASLSGCWHHGHHGDDHPGSWGDHAPDHR
jgi:hypothetical protein